MSVDDRDKGPEKEKPAGDSPAPDGSPSLHGLKGSKEIRDALQSKTDEPLPPLAEAIAERDAQLIVSWREQHGKFKNFEEVRKVPGLDAAILADKRGWMSFE